MAENGNAKRIGKIKFILIIAVILFGLIQFWPYGGNHTNPPVTGEPAWKDTATRERFYRSCGDCHSNQSVWPWYSHVAPSSWLVQFDVDKGRSKVNVSEWGRAENDAGEAVAKVRDGEMPPWFYLIPHPSAKMTDREKEEFISGLSATFGESEDDFDDD